MINAEAHADFWYFVNSRERIRQKKEAGEPKPWTQDPILRDWKFCNVFRRDDKQSKWLIDNVYHYKLVPELIVFNTFVFRAFNWHPTFELLMTPGVKFISDWDIKTVKKILYDKIGFGGKLTSGAYMIRGYEGKSKLDSIPEVLQEVWLHRVELAEAIEKLPTMENAHNQILSKQFWGWGDFTAYQVVLDMTYTHLLENASDINTWCVFGPGAQGGLKEIWPNIKKSEMLDAAKSLLHEQYKYYEHHFLEMTLQDIEFCLCELLKYRRIKKGGRGKTRYYGF